MKLGLFTRLAWSNIKKNHQLYVPHILAGTGLTAIFYVMTTLANDERLEKVKGGRSIPAIMGIGCAVVAILSVILVFFTNSFLMKQRTREYGMYNVLGMEKRHVGHIMFLENLISSVISIVSGILTGVLIYKLCCLIICKMLRVDTILGFYVDVRFVLSTAGGFAAMYFLAFIWNRIRLARLRPVELLSSAGAGEKEPKIKWVFLVIGLATLGAGYTIALTSESPLEAIPDFFKAVILVIIGTYALFLAGSIALLKFLRNRKGFYYRRKNMVAVSDLLYRMKQNAVGLASIAILATGVLVMISATVCLYTGIEDTINKLFLDGRADVMLTANYVTDDENDMNVRIVKQIPYENVKQIAEKTAEKYDSKITSFNLLRSWSDIVCTTDGKTKPVDFNSVLDKLPKGSFQLVILPLEDYNVLCGDTLSLQDGEIGWVAISEGCESFAKKFPGGISFGDCSFRIGPEVKKMPIAAGEIELSDYYGLVVSSVDELEAFWESFKKEYEGIQGSYNNTALSGIEYNYYIRMSNVDKLAEKGVDRSIEETFTDFTIEYLKENGIEYGYCRSFWDSTWEMRDELYSMYGSLFFLGILLSIVFLFATALIIYYKQVSEGYDDRERFQILQKVGMTQKETKATIRRQIVIVFFLPLVTAVIHMAVAYPVIRRLLRILMMPKDALFLTWTALTIVAFTVIYLVIYRLTARTYYRIVR